MADIAFKESLVTIIEEPLTCEQVESRIAGILQEQGFAKETYTQAILDREKSYPTALDVEGINVAIPHCDIVNVNAPALCMGVLRHPTPWHRMDEPDETCDVSLVVMLALTEAHAHLGMLQRVISLVQDQDLAARIISAKDASEAYALAAEHLLAPQE